MATLSTTRLTIRSFDPTKSSDYESLIALSKTPMFIKFNGNKGDVTPSDIDQRMATGKIDPTLCTGKTPCPPISTFLAYLKSTDEFIGIVTMVQRKPILPPDLGYNFMEEFTNQGYGTEASSEVLRFWIEDVGLKAVWIGTFPTNVRSQRVAEKLGFVPGGVLNARFPAGSDMGVMEISAFVLPSMKPFPEGITFDVKAVKESEDTPELA